MTRRLICEGAWPVNFSTANIDQSMRKWSYSYFHKTRTIDFANIVILFIVFVTTLFPFYISFRATFFAEPAKMDLSRYVVHY